MAFQEVTNQSCGSRFVSSIGGALFGVVLFLVAFPVLWWNEGNAVETEQSLTEGAKNVVSIDSDKVDSANEGKEVHISAKAVTDDTPADPDFGVKAPKDIRLIRKVEMYQYKEEVHTETTKKLGGGEQTTKSYTYPPDWYEGFQDSNKFEDPKFRGKNPPRMPYTSSSWQAEKVTAGAFELPGNLVSEINAATAYPVPGGSKTLDKEAPKPPEKDAPKASDKEAPKAPEKDSPKPSEKDSPKPPVADQPSTKDVHDPNAPEGYKVVQGQFYKGADENSPEIGDVRVSYTVVEPTTVSVIAKQSGASFVPYQTKAGKTIEMLEIGKQDADAMFKHAQDANVMLTWLLRIVGFAMMGFGLFLVMNPISVMGDVVPFIGNMVGMLLAVVAGMLALGLSLITISIAWVFYRPIIGIPLLIAGVGAIVLMFMFARKRKAPAAPAGV